MTTDRPTANLPPPELPAQPGTYALLFRVERPITLRAGRLGAVTLAAGHYVYLGSARGPGGLRARVGRHLRTAKKPHWHVDALTAAAPIVAVWFQTGTERLECAWAEALRLLPGATIPARGFGASDCGCESHLLGLADVPAAQAALHETWPISGLDL